MIGMMLAVRRQSRERSRLILQSSASPVGTSRPVRAVPFVPERLFLRSTRHTDGVLRSSQLKHPRARRASRYALARRLPVIPKEHSMAGLSAASASSSLVHSRLEWLGEQCTALTEIGTPRIAQARAAR